MTTLTTNKPLTTPQVICSSESPPVTKQKTPPKSPPKTPPIIKTPPTERKAPLSISVPEATPIETEALPTSTALGNGSVHAKPYHWLGELPVISEPKEEEEEEKEEEEEEERIKSSIPINRTESPSTWRRSDSYENFQVTDLMPQISQSPMSPSPLLHSATPPLTRPSTQRLYQTTPPPRPHSAQRNYPLLLKVAQSEEDLLSESDDQKRKKRRQMTLSVRSYDTDTP
uniref:Uncharacterized protein n=1 Tax=Amphimedon queenslandica TaxID=400682 RepID=A0A1X7SF51_AMPQE